MDHNNRNFHQNCTKKKNPKKIYERAVKNTQKIEARIFNHNRTSRKDTNIRENKNIERII